MPRTFTCHHCGKVLPRNPRIKKQKYCSLLACQNARKRLFDKRASPSSKFKLLQKRRNARWRDAYPAHEYQMRYRETHPGYVKGNVELQRERNKKHQKEQGSMIVKTDTLLLQMQSQTDVDAFSQLNPG